MIVVPVSVTRSAPWSKKSLVMLREGHRRLQPAVVGLHGWASRSARELTTLVARDIRVCYEAGPTGFGLHRLLTSMGVACDVVAPALVSKTPGDRGQDRPA
jgi:transposase